MKIFFKQNGVSLIELLVGALILVITGLMVSSLFLRGSINLITSGEETVALSCMQELAEEVRSVARQYYRYIKVGVNPTSNPATHHHINIPCLVQASTTGTTVNFTVVAHDANHNRTNEQLSSTFVRIEWQKVEGEGTVTVNFPQEVSLINNGISEQKQATFKLTGSKPVRGYLHIERFPGGPRTEKAAGIIVYPQEGEQIREGKQLIGTRKAVFELFDDPLDNNPPFDLLPGDYMKGTITFTWQAKRGAGINTKQLVTIIVPFPEP